MSARSRPRRERGDRGVALWLAAAAVLTSAAAFGAFREARDPRFGLSAPEVAGTRMTPVDAVIRAAAFPKGSNIWLLDTASAARRVEALPWVLDARIHRTWPNRLRIDVTERAPVARIVLPSSGDAEEPVDSVALIDETLRVLSIEPVDALRAGDRTLPLFRIKPAPRLEAGSAAAGDALQSAYDMLLQLRGLGLRVSEVDLSPATGAAAVCYDGLRVLFGGEEALADKVALLRAIAPKIAQPHDVVYVDLRSVRAPTVLYR